MSAIHINQIRRKISELFEAHVPKDDLTPHDPQRDDKIITRCLAAYGVYASTGCEPQEAAASVTDGGDDNGLDAVFFSPSTRTIVLVQSKWIKDGAGEPDSAEVAKFCKGVKDLLNLEFDRFNDRLQRRQDSIASALQAFDVKVVLALTSTSNATELAKHASQHVEDLLREINDPTDVATFRFQNQSVIYKSLAAGVSGEPIDLEFGLANWGKVDSPHEAFYGTVTGEEVADWWKEYGDRLFSQNLRGVLGDTDVNQGILQTISQSPDDFWYFNNGVTVVAKSVQKTLAGASSRELGNFKAKEANVVNGAQTVSTIGRFGGNVEQLKRVRIPLRVISLAGATEDYGATVTRTNNTQNRIEARDFLAQEPEQIRIRTELAVEGIDYCITRTESFRASDTAFDVQEATAALACANGDPALAVQAKREIGRFWIDLTKSPYKAIFNPSTSALFVYRSVMLLRQIEKAIADEIKNLPKRSGRKYGVLVHGNRLLESLVFECFGINRAGNAPTFDFVASGETAQNLARQIVDDLTDAVTKRCPENFLAVVFKNPSKCRELFDDCMKARKLIAANTSQIPLL